MLKKELLTKRKQSYNLYKKCFYCSTFYDYVTLYDYILVKICENMFQPLDDLYYIIMYPVILYLYYLRLLLLILPSSMYN